MTYPHTMRLREPWIRSRQDGVLRFSRKFNWVAELAAREQVWLVVEGLSLPAAVALNDRPLGEIPLDQRPAEFDITSLLASRNEIMIDVRAADDVPDDTQLGTVSVQVRLGPARL